MNQGLKYALLFSLLSGLDALTTWVGVHRGFSEANPAVASRLVSPLLFFGSFALFTLLGVIMIMASIYLTKLSKAFYYFPSLFLVLKAIPVVNNLYLLSRESPALLFLPLGFLLLP
jgi:hypothetical protein